MAYITKDRVREILNNAPEGTTPTGIIQALREKGHTLEGYEEDKPGFIDVTKGILQERSSMAQQILERRDDRTKLETTAGLAGQAIQTVTETGFEALKRGAVGLFKTVTTKKQEAKVKEKFSDVGKRFMESYMAEPTRGLISGISTAWKELKDTSPRTAENIVSAIGISEALPLLKGKGKPTGISTKLEKGLVGATKQADELIEVERREFLKDLLQPEQTKKVKVDQVSRTTETGAGPFKKSIIEPTKAEATSAEALYGIKGIQPNNTVQRNYNIASAANRQKGIQLEADIKKHDFIIPKRNIVFSLNKAKEVIGQNPTIVGDAKKTADKLIAGAERIINKNKGTGSGLLKTRKEYDQWVLLQKPKAFDSASENAFTIANREIRKSMNDLLDEKAINVEVKKSLREQSALYNALSIMEVKAATEADTAFLRLLQRTGEKLGTKNKIVQGVAAAVGIGGLGAAATFAPAAAAVMISGMLIHKGGKFILSPTVRKNIFSVMIDISREIPKTTVAVEIEALKELKDGLKQFLEDYE